MKVVRKQNNSKLCIICGVNNEYGLKAPFYEMEDKRVVSIFTYREKHQSYPERVHGGMITCMLDEIAGRAVWPIEPNCLAVTTSINVKFRKPVPYDTTLYAVGKIIENTKRAIVAESCVMDEEGHILAQADVNYLKLPATQITGKNMVEELDEYIPDDVTEINI